MSGTLRKVLFSPLVWLLVGFPSLSYADFCSKNPNDPRFLRVVRINSERVEIQNCAKADPRKCDRIGGRALRTEQLRDATLLASKAAGGLAVADTLGLEPMLKALATGNSGDGEKVSWSGIILGWVHHAITAMPQKLVVSLTPVYADARLVQMDPALLKRSAGLLEVLERDPGPGKCVELSADLSIDRRAAAIDQILDICDADPRAVVEVRRKADQSSAVARGADVSPHESLAPVASAAN